MQDKVYDQLYKCFLDKRIPVKQVFDNIHRYYKKKDEGIIFYLIFFYCEFYSKDLPDLLPHLTVDKVALRIYFYEWKKMTDTLVAFLNYKITFLQFKRRPYIYAKSDKGCTMLKNNEAYKMMFRQYPDVVNVEQMCEMLGGISTKTGYHILKENRIKYFMIGRTYKIPKLCIFEYLGVIKNNTL